MDETWTTPEGLEARVVLTETGFAITFDTLSDAYDTLEKAGFGFISGKEE